MYLLFSYPILYWDYFPFLLFWGFSMNIMLIFFSVFDPFVKYKVPSWKLLRPNPTVGFCRIWSDSAGFGRIWSDLDRFGLIWSDLVGFGLIWSDLVGVASGRGPNIISDTV